MKSSINVLFAVLLLSLVVACGGEKSETESTAENEIVSLRTDVPEEAPEDSNQVPVIVETPPTQPQQPSSPTVGTLPTPLSPPTGPAVPNSPPSGGIPPIVGGRNLHVQENAFPSNVEVSQTPTRLRHTDLQINLSKIYPFVSRTAVFPSGSEFVIDPVSHIRPLDASATMRFFQTSSLVLPRESFLEVNFSVVFPHRIEYTPEENAWQECQQGNRQPGSYRRSFCTDWVEFHLKACDANNRCQEVLHDIPAPASCAPDAPSCEQSYHARIEAAQFPGGRFAGNHHFIVEVEGTTQADYIGECAEARLCSRDDDCTIAHPYCEAGLCTAIEDGDFYQAVTPESLI